MVVDVVEALDVANLKTAMGRVAAEIEATLSDLLPVPLGPESRLALAMRYAALGGGKRMRAFLVVETASMLNCPRASSLRVGAAIEMLHAYSLVHDDLPAMDDDDMRRGKPSTHKAFDEATAILAGDALQARAFEVLAEPETHTDPLARCHLVMELGRASGAAGMAGGQMVDIVSEGIALSDEEIMRLQALKTGRLIQFSVEAGAILGGASAADRLALAAYGRDLGAAFQIADDLLDATGAADEVGKATGKDAAAGKATLIAVLGVAGARARAASLAEAAVAHLAPFGTGAELLRDMAEFVTARRN